MEFEFCNIYRRIFDKILLFLQRFPDAIDILQNPNDYEYIFFIILSQFIPYLKYMKEGRSLINDYLLEYEIRI